MAPRRGNTQQMLKITIAMVGTAALVLALSGCFGATRQQLHARAAYDLQCNTLAEHPLDDRTRGVEGCGRQAVYVEICRPCANGSVSCECTWVLNSDVQAQGFPPQQGPTATSSGTRL